MDKTANKTKWNQTLTEAVFALSFSHTVPVQQVVPGRPLELGPGVPQVELPAVNKQMGTESQVSGMHFLFTHKVRMTILGVFEILPKTYKQGNRIIDCG